MTEDTCKITKIDIKQPQRDIVATQRFKRQQKDAKLLKIDLNQLKIAQNIPKVTHNNYNEMQNNYCISTVDPEESVWMCLSEEMQLEELNSAFKKCVFVL